MTNEEQWPPVGLSQKPSAVFPRTVSPQPGVPFMLRRAGEEPCLAICAPDGAPAGATVQ